MNLLTIITARSGSKGLKNKHLLKLGSKKLIEHTLELANKIDEFGTRIISTDSKEIIKISKKYNNIKAPFVRPKEFSGDDAKQIDVIFHALDYFKNKNPFTHVILLQPTSPFRTREEMINGIRMLNDGVNSVIGVCESINHPADFLKYDGVKLNWLLESYKGKNRQNFEKYYFNNGAFYATSVYLLKTKKIIYDENSKLLLMNKNSFIDIDDQYDLELANKIIKNEKKI